MTDQTEPVLESDKTAWAAVKAREMLALGINIQATGDATNAIVEGLLRSLIAHVDELESDLKCAIAVGRIAARRSENVASLGGEAD